MTRFSLTVLHLLLAFCLAAQSSGNPARVNDKSIDVEIVNLQIDYLYSVYAKYVKNSYELVNGKEYRPTFFYSKEKPILFSDRKHKSSIIFKGRRYDDVWLEYETFLDELLYSDSINLIDNKTFKICMNKDLVNGFILYYSEDTLDFKYLSPEYNQAFNLSEGFYEVVYPGKSKYIIGHRSHLLEKEGREEYIYEPEYYILKDGEYKRIKNLREFLDLFGSISGEIKKYMRINKINFRKGDKKEIAEVLGFYDNLNLLNR